MEIRFIGQGYNQAIGSSVAQELINALGNRDFTSFKCLVAFASVSGVSALTPHIQNSHIRTHRIIVGIDQKGTSKEALEELLNWRTDVFVYYTRQNIIFHPKIYLFEGNERALIIVGSNNFTQRGLVENIEGSFVVEINKAVDSRRILDDVENVLAPY
jgi:HKD family nuclease